MIDKIATTLATLLGKMMEFCLRAWLLQLVWNWFTGKFIFAEFYALNYKQALAILFITGILFRSGGKQ
jgi:hypothetical protein